MDDRIFESYFRKNCLTPKLSKEEEFDCVITIKNSVDPFLVDKYTRKLLQNTLKTVLNIAKKYEGRGLSLEDLVNEGCLGLEDALKTFDLYYNPQTRFTTHAYWYIRSKILEALNTKTPNLPLPRFKLITYWKLIKGEDVKEKDKKALNNVLHKAVSLDALSEIPDFEQKFNIIDYNTPETELIKKTNEEYLVSRLKEFLTLKEFEIASYLSGLGEFEQLTKKELAVKLNIKISALRYRIKKIREKLICGKVVKCLGTKKYEVMWK